MRRSFDRSTMAPLSCSHHLRTAAVRVGTSKAQAGLAKIIAIISTVPPPPIERRGGNSEAARAGGLGFGIDLNLRLGPPPEIGAGAGGSSGNDEEEEEEEGGDPTAQSVVVADDVAERAESGEESTVEKGSGRAPRAVEESRAISPAGRSSEGECDPEEESRKEAAEGAKESSGITTAPSRKADDGDEEEEAVVEVVKKERDEEAKETKGGGAGEGRDEAGRNPRKGNGSGGYLDLLLEAVRQVSGGLFDEEPAKEKEETADAEEERPSKRRAAGVAQGSKRRGAGWLPFDLYVDSAPIVRSKRGRNQALPSRYRDSVLDPWRKLPTVTRHRRAARP
ncbi:coiled-coil domain-containing protein 96-like [Phoenix dactylifera]|uniref:Coiled-coil domain-containing protein 96-like n=1 Tax=Phoenix dactylifera TaxID=42345 RepID=A0A8B9AZG9_PHODC|nr:coiled-coil domain-containing protein 96-like [Phoenix dactylifera]